VSAWCNPDTASKDQRFVSKWTIGTGGTQPDLFILWYDVGGANVGYAFTVKNATASGQSFAGIDIASGAPGEWSHVVGVYDSSGPTISLYVNGVLIESNAAVSTVNWNSNDSQSPLRIGSVNTERCDGLAQNVRLWNRALTADEIWSIYANPWLGSNYKLASGSTPLYNYIFRTERFRRLG
jgi:hypothetical protein